jgi:hypothetical protein
MAAQNPYQLSNADLAEIKTWAGASGLNVENQIKGAQDLLISGQAANMDDLRRLALSKTGKTSPYQLTAENETEIRNWATGRGLNPDVQLGSARGLLASGQATDFAGLKNLVAAKDTQEQVGAAKYTLSPEEASEIRAWAVGRGLNPDIQLQEANKLLLNGSARSFNDLKAMVMAKDERAAAAAPGTTTGPGGITTYTPITSAGDVVQKPTITRPDISAYTSAKYDPASVKTATTSGPTSTGYDAKIYGQDTVKTATTSGPTAVGYDAATYISQGYTPETYTAEGYTADTRGYKTYDAKQGQVSNWAVDPSQTVEGRLQGLLSKGSPLLTLAETRARQGMNRKGLLNSSMAEGEALRAITETATPIATADAATFAKAAQFNAEQQNLMEQFNVREVNASAAFNAESANQALSDNQRAINASREFLANANNAASAFNAQSKNDAAAFAADAANAAKAAAALAENNARAFTAQAQNTASIEASRAANQAAIQAAADANQLNRDAMAIENAAREFSAQAQNTAAIETSRASNQAAIQAAADANQFNREALAAENRAKEFEAQAKNTANVEEARAKNIAAAQAIADAQRLRERAQDAQNEARRFEADAKNRQAEQERLIAADKDLADFNRRAQVSEQATTLFQQTTDNIAKLMADPDLETAAKQAAVDQQKANLNTSLQFLEQVNKVDGLTDLLKFG